MGEKMFCCIYTPKQLSIGYNVEFRFEMIFYLKPLSTCKNEDNDANILQYFLDIYLHLAMWS